MHTYMYMHIYSYTSILSIKLPINTIDINDDLDFEDSLNSKPVLNKICI